MDCDIFMSTSVVLSAFGVSAHLKRVVRFIRQGEKVNALQRASLGSKMDEEAKLIKQRAISEAKYLFQEAYVKIFLNANPVDFASRQHELLLRIAKLLSIAYDC
jgi:hypothetical protein